MAYSKEEKTRIIDEVCDRVANGEAVRNVLMESQYPAAKNFFKWLDKDEEKSKQYARALQYRADYLFDEIIAIADENNADVYVDDTGEAKIDGNTVQRSRLRVDARKWAASKLNSKKYGDKLDMTTDGHRIKQPKNVNITFKDYSGDSD